MKTMQNITPKYSLGDIVYPVISSEFTGMVTAIMFKGTGMLYGVTWSNDMEEKWHSENELQTEKKTFEI